MSSYLSPEADFCLTSGLARQVSAASYTREYDHTELDTIQPLTTPDLVKRIKADNVQWEALIKTAGMTPA